MIPESLMTLVNPVDGNLAFRIVFFEDDNYFRSLQRNSYFSIIWLFEGEGTIKANFSQYSFGKNTMIFFAPFEPFVLATEGGVKGVMLNFHPDFFCIIRHQKEVACNGILFNNIYQAPFVTVNESEVTMFHGLIDQIKREVQNKSLAQYELLVSYLKIFLIQATRLKVQENPSDEQQSELEEPFILQNLKNAIEQHFREKHSAGEYAEMLNISAKALAKLSKNHFNKTLTDLISDRIVIEAKRDLYLTSKPIKEIAYELGFKDEYYFSRYFKNITKVSPQMYRESLKTARAEVQTK
jgi:AraC family transcriptional regulator, transcriptional activator of pobA